MNKQTLLQNASAERRRVAMIDLTEFDSRFVEEDGQGGTRPQIVEVLLNPSVEEVKRVNAIQDDEVRGAQRVGLHMGLTPEEITQLFADANDNSFLVWLSSRVMEQVTGYAAGQAKKTVTG